MDMKTTEIEYQKRLSAFSAYRKAGVDLAFRCARCGKLVLQTDILHGVGCRKCNSSSVVPITESLTRFGVYYCRFWNWIWNKYHEKHRTQDVAF